MPITWKNVNAPDVGGANYGISQAANTIGRAGETLGDLFNDIRDTNVDNWENQKQRNTDDMIAALQGMTKNADVQGLNALESAYQVQNLRDRFGAQVDASKLSEIYDNSVNKAQMDSVSGKVLDMMNKSNASEADIRKGLMGSEEFLRLDAAEQFKVLGDLRDEYQARNSLTDEQVHNMNYAQQQSDLNYDNQIAQAEADYNSALSTIPASTRIGNTTLDQIMSGKDSFQDIILAKSKEDDGFFGDWFSKNGNDLVQEVDKLVGSSDANPEVIKAMVGHMIVPDRDGEVTESQIITAINRARGLYAKESVNAKLRSELTKKHRGLINGLRKNKLGARESIYQSYRK